MMMDRLMDSFPLLTGWKCCVSGSLSLSKGTEGDELCLCASTTQQEVDQHVSHVVSGTFKFIEVG